MSTAAPPDVIASRRSVGRPGPATLHAAGEGRPGRYGRALLPVLERIWHASDELCGKLLAPILPTLLAALETHHGLQLAPDTRTALTAASPATLDLLLRPLRRRRGRQPQRAAAALGLLRAQVPVRTWADWTGVTAGALQGDLVLHWWGLDGPASTSRRSSPSTWRRRGRSCSHLRAA